jgi:hypothetical protein
VNLTRWPVSSRVLVNMEDGRAFDGLLVAKRGPLLELADARLLAPGAEPVKVDGRVLVERPKVSFIQVRP